MHLGGIQEMQVTCASLQPPTSIFADGREGRSAKICSNRLNVITIDLPPLAPSSRNVPLRWTTSSRIFGRERAPATRRHRPKPYGRW